MELQNKILTDFVEAIKNMLCNGHNNMIDFQHGIVVSSAALPQLYDELYLEYQVCQQIFQHLKGIKDKDSVA